VDPTLATAAVLTTALYPWPPSAWRLVSLARMRSCTGAKPAGRTCFAVHLMLARCPAFRVRFLSGAAVSRLFSPPRPAGPDALRFVVQRLVFNGLSTVVLSAVFRWWRRSCKGCRRPRHFACTGAAAGLRRCDPVGREPLASGHEVYLLNEVIGLKALSPEQLQYAEKLLPAARGTAVAGPGDTGRGPGGV